MNTDSLQRPRAFITGATSGIGAAFAERLARDGYDVTLLGRRQERLNMLASRLTAQYGTAAQVVLADLSDPDVLPPIEETLSRDAPDILINNAGFTPLVPFVEQDPDEIEAMIRVHVVALVRLTRGVLPGMMARRSGDIINVSSDGVFAPEPSPLMVNYAATKAYVNTFTRALHRQVSGTGIRVQALCPGYVQTEILERFGITFDEWNIPAAAVMSAEDQVEASLAGLALGEVICVPTLSDPSLLDQIDVLNDTIRNESSSTGVPAARYRPTVNPSAPEP